MRYRAVMIDEGYESYETETRLLAEAGCSFREQPCDYDPARIAAAVADADAVLLREAPLPRAAIEGMARGKAIVRYGAGVDNVDLNAARDKGIKVANVPDYGVEEVSDQALALLMAVVRRVATRDRDVRGGAWNVARREPMFRIAGKTLGICGYGRIGRTFHRKAAGLDFARTLIYDPYLTDPPPGTERVDLDTLCAEADILSLHMPLTAETRHMIDAARIAAIPSNAVLINVSRGGLIDEDALAAALTEGHLFGAGLDVFEQEPPALSHPLFQSPSVVISDHTGWYSEESVADLQRKAAEEVVRILEGREPRNWVNRWTEKAAS